MAKKDDVPRAFTLSGQALHNYIEESYKNAFGSTREEAQSKNVCVNCKEPPTFTTDAGRREYEISGVCEPCFDKMFPPEV